MIQYKKDVSLYMTLKHIFYIMSINNVSIVNLITRSFNWRCVSLKMTFKSKKWFYENNGKKGGRPKQDSKICIKLPEIKKVILTKPQYNTLVEKYGFKLLSRAIKILDNWLISGSPNAIKYVGKNNYAHFRSDGWVINEARRYS